jgi:DNA-binding Lrp family transcriptional regulator
VGHNYLRDHAWNLWFTLAVPASRELADEVARLAGPAETLILPAVRTFKLRVHLPFSRQAPSSEREARRQEARRQEEAGTLPPAALSPFEARLLERLESPLPLVPAPWREIAGALGAAEEEVLAAVGELKQKGVLRRIAVVLHHRRAGFRANAMVCFRLPEERVEPAGLKAARLHQVSHCYQREARPQWPYSLYAMVHARAREDCDALVRELAADIGGEDCQVLYSVRELKKQRIKYFGVHQ